MPRLERLVLGPLTGEIGIQAGDSPLEAGSRPEELLPVKPPLDLVGLGRVPVLGHHPELLAKSGHVGGGRRQLALRRFAPLSGLIAVVRHLIALLFDPVDRLPQFRQRRTDGFQLLTEPPILLLERLSLARPPAAWLPLRRQFG